MVTAHAIAQSETDTAGFRRVDASAPLKRRKFLEFFEAAINLSARERAEPFDAEAFTAIASHHGAVDHRAADFIVIDALGVEIDTLAGEIAHKAAGKAIACAGG